MERNWKSPLLSLTFNFQPNANSIPQLLLRKPRNDYLSSARYYDSSNSRPNVIRIYIYIYTLQIARILSYRRLTSKKKRLEPSPNLPNDRAARRSLRCQSTEAPPPPPPPPEKESNTFRLPRYSSRPSPGTSLNDDEWRVRKKERIRRSVVSFVDVTVQTSFP